MSMLILLIYKNIHFNKSIYTYTPKRLFFSSCMSRVQYFSNYTHPPDVLDRFKHVQSSYTNNSSYTDNNLYFNSQNSEKKSSDCQKPRDSLNNYSFESVESALMQFVPEYISKTKDEGGNTFMTPGQCFFLENKDKLMETVKKRYNEEKNMLKNRPEEGMDDDDFYSSLLNYDFNEESYGSYGSEYIQTRKKEQLWDYNADSISVPRKPIELTKGVMPTIQQMLEILEQERLVNVSVIDMDKCDRRDQGMYVIIATGTTSEHCRRVGRMLYNVIVDLEIPFVSKISYCCKSRNDEWIISHLGPLSVHLMIESVRKKYSLEEFWSEHFSTKDDISQHNLIE